MYLAASGCLLLTRQMPRAYQACVTDEDYAKLVAYYSERRLPSVDIDSLSDIFPDVQSLTAAVEEKRADTWLPRALDPKACTAEHVARQRCISSLAVHLGTRALSDEHCQKGTWVAKHVLPLMALMRSADICYDVDATTEYNIKRPDVFLQLGDHLEHAGRAISSWEVRPHGASSVEKQQDLARVIVSCIQYLKAEHSKFVGEVTAQYKLAVHLHGWEGTV